MTELQAQPPTETDFTIVYNGNDIQISRFKLAVASPKFQKIPNFMETKSLQVTGTTPLPTFQNFLEAAQNNAKIEINQENAADLLNLANEWEIESLQTEIKEFINSNSDLQTIIEQLQQKENDEPNSELESTLASHLDSVLSIESFSNFKVPVISRIINNPNRLNRNHTELFHFIMSMIERYGAEAYELAHCIDVRQLSPEDSLTLLGHDCMKENTLTQSISAALSMLIQENMELREQFDGAKSKINSLSVRLEAVEQNNPENDSQTSKKIQDIMTKYQAISEHVEGVDSEKTRELEIEIDQVDQKIATSEKQIRDFGTKKVKEFEQKAKKDLKKTQTIVNSISTKMTELETKQETLMNENSIMLKTLVEAQQKLAEAQKSIQDLQKEQVCSAPSFGKNPIFVLYNRAPFNGILKYFSDICNGNLNDPNGVLITASSSEHNSPTQVADFEWDDFWYSQNEVDQWIMFDFQNVKVGITNYTIKTHRYSTDSTHMRSWDLEGSNDNTNWIVIDQRSTDILNGSSIVQVFMCKPIEQTFQYIRIRQTEENHRGDNILALTNVEFFGHIFE